MKFNLPLYLSAAVAAIAPSSALAAPGGSTQMTGSALVNIVTPGAVTPLRALRFGQFLQPASAGTITVTPASAVTAAGGAVGNIGIPQIAPGRGSGAFTLTGGANRSFFVTLPTLATITSGSNTMRVTNFTANTAFAGFGTLNSSGTYILNVGGRLNVGAAQPIGSYTGTYTITVAFL